MAAQTHDRVRYVPLLLVLAVSFGIAIRLILALFPGYITDQISWADYARYIVVNGLPHVYALTLRKTFLGV